MISTVMMMYSCVLSTGSCHHYRPLPAHTHQEKYALHYVSLRPWLQLGALWCAPGAALVRKEHTTRRSQGFGLAGGAFVPETSPRYVRISRQYPLKGGWSCRLTQWRSSFCSSHSPPLPLASMLPANVGRDKHSPHRAPQCPWSNPGHVIHGARTYP
jgi:hypothetical protein